MCLSEFHPWVLGLPALSTHSPGSSAVLQPGLRNSAMSASGSWFPEASTRDWKRGKPSRPNHARPQRCQVAQRPRVTPASRARTRVSTSGLLGGLHPCLSWSNRLSHPHPMTRLPATPSPVIMAASSSQAGLIAHQGRRGRGHPESHRLAAPGSLAFEAGMPGPQVAASPGSGAGLGHPEAPSPSQKPAWGPTIQAAFQKVKRGLGAAPRNPAQHPSCGC